MLNILRTPFFQFLTLAALLSSCGSQEKESSETQTVHNVFLINPVLADAAATRDFAGQVEEARTVGAAFKTGGTIEHIYAKEGDRVRKGQLLAVLDSIDYVLGTEQLRIQTARFKDEFARTTKLYATGGVSDNDYEKAKSGLRQLEYQLALNENKIKYCRLLSPADGVITAVNYETGEMTDAGRPLFDIMDNRHLEIVVDLPASEYMRSNEFTAFTGHSPLLPGKTFPLQMLSLTPRADNNQLFRLRLSPASDSDITLAPGMNITVAITAAGSGSDAVTVPVNSVFDHDGQTAVYTFNQSDSTISLTPVTISGTGADGNITVISGLSPSQPIVRAGVHHLVPGEKVNVIDQTSASNVGNLL